MPQLVRVVASLFLCLFNQHHSISRDTFFATGKAQFLGSGSFDRDIIFVAANHLGHAGFHFGDVWVHLWALGADSGINVHQLRVEFYSKAVCRS